MSHCIATVLPVCLLMSGGVFAQHAPEHWQQLAKGDLDAARHLILDAHPGAIDQANPELRDWIDSGHKAATALVPEIFNYDSMLAVVRFYITGFEDGHLLYSDNIRPNNAKMLTTGWRTEYRHGRPVVTLVAPTWPAPLPPVGSELVACDGLAVDALVEQRVAPFIDRREFKSVRHSLVQMLDLLMLKRHALQRCEFIAPGSQRLSLEVRYQSLTTDAYWDTLVVGNPSVDRNNGYSLDEGVLWIRAPDFSLSPEAVSARDTMLAELRAMEAPKAIVFDVRGNGGGDSSVGDKIFEAATGGLEFDTSNLELLPEVHAQWRVSDVAIRSAERFVERRLGQYGEGSEEVVYARTHLKRLQGAKRAGEPWVEQPSGRHIDRAEVARRGGRLARFDGPVALVTDASCASACLDFADLVLQVPGALHIGEETSGDAVYIDTAREVLPSGNGFVIPLKVWRNRLRGNNETLVPDYPIALDSLDETTVRAKVLEIVTAQIGDSSPKPATTWYVPAGSATCGKKRGQTQLAGEALGVASAVGAN